MGQSTSSRLWSRSELTFKRKRASKNNPRFKMAVDAAEIKKICGIYDWHGKGELDMYYFDEVVNLINQAVKEPDHTGNYHDYIELCKLYDKNENGTIMIAELETFLTLLGDEIPKEDVQKLLEELAPKEDDEGFIPYAPFLDKLCGKA